LSEERENQLAPATSNDAAADGLTPAAEKAILSEIKTLLVSRQFSGPMPPPECLHQYDQIVPGAAREIIDEFRANGAHQRTMDQAVLEAASTRDTRGQWMACSLVLLGFILIMSLAYTGHDGVAIAVAVSLLGAVAANFLQGKKSESSQPAKDSDSAEED